MVLCLAQQGYEVYKEYQGRAKMKDIKVKGMRNIMTNSQNEISSSLDLTTNKTEKNLITVTGDEEKVFNVVKSVERFGDENLTVAAGDNSQTIIKTRLSDQTGTKNLHVKSQGMDHSLDASHSSVLMSLSRSNGLNRDGSSPILVSNYPEGESHFVQKKKA